MERNSKSEKAFSNWRNGAFHLNFPNGNWLSTTFSYGSYSENHDAEWPVSNEFVRLESNSCEIMVECPEELHKKIWKKYGSDTDNLVLGYLTITQWFEIVALLSK